jgi:hypothetical protein
MRTIRHLMIAIVTIGALVASTPAFAQTETPANAPSLTMPLFTGLKVSTPSATFMPRAQERNEQGLGFFLQGGWVNATTYGENGAPTGGFDTSANGWILGIGFGGNKSGKFGIGADINYIRRGPNTVVLFSDDFFGIGELTRDSLQVPIYGRITFFGHSTKNAPSLYALVGGYVEILMKAKLDSFNVKEQFNGFDMGILAGLGFEVARIGFEYRAYWALRTLVSTGHGTFLNGLEDSKAFTHVFLFKLRIN